MNFEPLWLDAAVKWSRIATPLVLAIAGWYVTNALNRRSHMTKLKSELHLEWSRKFIEKCFEYSDFITSLQMKIWEYYEQNDRLCAMKNSEDDEKVVREKEKLDVISTELYSFTLLAKKLKYEIDVYSKFVEHTKACKKQVDLSFEAISKNYSQLKLKKSTIDFESPKKAQANLLKELQVLQKKVLET